MQKYLFIIGAPKSGTTSFARWLNGNDRFFLPTEKEPGLFRTPIDSYVMNTRGERLTININYDPDAYMALYEPATADQWRIDASTDYLSDVGAAERIKAFAEGRRVKVMCILRDPVDRAFSEYMHTIRDGLQSDSFRRAIELEDSRRREDYQPLFLHVRRSRYYEDINRFRGLFGDDLLLLDYGVFAEPEKTLERLSAFLGEPVDIAAPPPMSNVSRVHTHIAARRFMRRSFLAPIARTVTTPRARETVRSVISSMFRRNLKLGAADRALLLDLLKDDIIACHNDPSIPTGSWTSALDVLEREGVG